MQLFLVVLWIASLWCIVSHGQAFEGYIKADGNDDSLNCGILQPCQSLSRALLVANGLPAKVHMLPGGIFIIPATINISTTVELVADGPDVNVNCPLGVACLAFRSANSSSLAGITFSGGNPALDITTFHNIQISGCNFTNSNRAIAVVSSESIIITNCTFQNNRASQGGAVLLNNATSVQIRSSNFYFNYADTGGAALTSSASTVFVDDTHFDHNNCSSGGAAIYSESSSINVNSSFFTSNYASSRGGAIQSQSQLQVVNSSFQFNSAASNGGAIFLNGNDNKIVSSIFLSNLAGSGGAIFANSPVAISDSVFHHNRASFGGCIFSSSSNARISTNSCTFYNCTSATRGGAVSVSSGAFQDINSTISGSTANTEGGAIYLEMVTFLSLAQTRFLNNSASNYGGAIYFKSTSASVNLFQTSFLGNIAYDKGGAIYFGNYTTANLSQVTFNSNSAPNSYGGAIYTTLVSLLLDSCDFYTNKAQFGAAIYAYDDGFVRIINNSFVSNSIRAIEGRRVNITVYSSRFINNSVPTGNSNAAGGGAIFLTSSTLQDAFSVYWNNSASATNSTGGAVRLDVSSSSFLSSSFDSNFAELAGAVYLNNALTSFTNCSFSNHAATLYGGAIASAGVALCTVTSCQFTSNGNANTRGGAVLLLNGTLVSKYSSYVGNKAAMGGAIYMNPQTSLDEQFSSFAMNYAQDGGALYLASSASVRHSQFSFNSANRGGAFYVDAMSLTLFNLSFFNNNAPLSGGAVCFNPSSNNPTTFDLDNCSFSGNSALNGGGISILNVPTEISFRNFLFYQNSAGGLGGGVYVENTNVTLDTVNFVQNSAGGGGGVALRDSALSARNCKFYSNTADSGGGLHTLKSSILINVCMIIGNNATQGGGISVDSLSSGAIINATITDNQAQKGGGLFLDSGISIVSSQIESKSGSGIYINSYSAESNLTVVSTLLSNDSPFTFCCGDYHTPTTSPSKILCDYPACSSGCGGAAGSCACKVPLTQPCTCDPFSTGAFCNIYNNCSSPDFCNATRYCMHDQQYNFACCNSNATCPDNSTQTTTTTSSTLSTTSLSSTISMSSTTSISSTTSLSSTSSLSSTTSISSTTSSTSSSTSTTGSAGNCAGRTCGENANCISNVCACNDGFHGNGFNCTDINECLTNNGLCDYRTNCRNTFGSRVCSDCPDVDFVPGNGNMTCIPLCGDGHCDPTVGENCVQCPEDCKISPCRQCGDSYCEPGLETCSSCTEDCGLCDQSKCPGTPVCSGHGTCHKGVCLCSHPWVGSECNQDNTPIEFNVTRTDPGFSVTPVTGGTSFTLTLSRIKETDPSGTSVSEVSLASMNYTFNLVNTSAASASSATFEDFETSETSTASATSSPFSGPCTNCSLTSYIHSSSSPSSTNKQWLMNATLNNTAYLEFMIWQFSDPQTTVTFARNSTTFPANTIKFAIQIRGWPFRSLHNSLSIVFASSSQASPSPSTCKEIKADQDENSNLRWLSLNVNGVTLYGQFMDRAIVDGNVRSVNFTLGVDDYDGNYSVSATLPHFWSNAVVDPNFNVLLEPKPKGCMANGRSTSLNGNKVKIIVSVMVVLTVASVAGLLLSPRVRSRLSVLVAKKRFRRTRARTSSSVELVRMSRSVTM